MTEFLEKISLKEIGNCFVGLFAVIDILGSLSIVVNIRQRVGFIDARKATIVASSIIILFLFFGTFFLNFIGIDKYAFSVAGAFVIFIFAIELLLGVQIHRDVAPESASIVPIAFPLVAGTGTLTFVLTLRGGYNDINIIIAIILNMIIVYLVLKYSEKLEKMLGPVIMSVFKKVFGIILLTFAIKIFTENIGKLFVQSF